MCVCVCVRARRYVWALYRTDAQIVIPQSESLGYFNSPLFSRANFNMMSYAAAHGLPPSPVALSWQLETVDPYVAYTWM